MSHVTSEHLKEEQLIHLVSQKRAVVNLSYCYAFGNCVPEFLWSAVLCVWIS